MKSTIFALKSLILTAICLWGAPRQAMADVDTIIFGSCIDQNKPQPIWKEVLKLKPDLLVLAGDNIYSSTPDQGAISAQYEKQNSHQDFKKVREAVPILATWDDHDFGQNDGGTTNPRKNEARTAFINNWPYVKELLKSSGAVYHSRFFGKRPELLQIILLDTRFDRTDLIANKQNWVERFFNPKPYSPNNAPDSRILSEEQWHWLEAELGKPADFKILVSSIQLIANDHQFEKWGNFPHERLRLFNLINKKKIKNLIIVSGDRHMSAIAKIELDEIGSLYELTASAINRPARSGNVLGDKSYLQEGYGKENFGLLQIDWKKKNATIEIRDISNKTVRTAKLNF